jgi:hypothetical protein
MVGVEVTMNGRSFAVVALIAVSDRIVEITALTDLQRVQRVVPPRTRGLSGSRLGSPRPPAGDVTDLQTPTIDGLAFVTCTYVL